MEGIPFQKRPCLRLAHRIIAHQRTSCNRRGPKGPCFAGYTFSKPAFLFAPDGWKTFPRMDWAGAGHTTSILAERGRIAAPDYRELYLEMFRANEAAIRLLQQAQARAEAAYLAQEPPPLRLQEKEPPPQ